ncbi:hypothetical protein KWH09_11730 [Xanthomonas campestris pv. olitorii]
MFPRNFAVSEGWLAENWLHQAVSEKNDEDSRMRPLSPASAIIANDLIDNIDNGLVDPHSPDQEIADSVNWRRTQHGQDALTQLGEMAPPWRRRVLPADPTPYQIQEIRQHRLNRASTSMQSAPPAPPPAVALSGELAFDPMDFLDIPDTPGAASCAESAPALQPAPPPAVALSGELAFDPMDFLDIPDTPGAASCAESAPALQEVANRSELSVPAGESVDCPAIAPPPPLSYSQGVGHYPAPSVSLLANSSTHAPSLPSQAPGSSMPGLIPNSMLAKRKKVIDPETGQTVSKAALAKRKKVIDPETGQTVSKAALAGRQKVIDPETGQTVSKAALAGRQKVIDPETGQTVSKAALAGRQKVIDPETGQTVSKAALAGRQKVIDPETGQTVSKAALAGRQKVIDPETGQTVSKAALAKRKKRRLNRPGA